MLFITNSHNYEGITVEVLRIGLRDNPMNIRVAGLSHHT